MVLSYPLAPATTHTLLPKIPFASDTPGLQSGLPKGHVMLASTQSMIRPSSGHMIFAMLIRLALEGVGVEC